MKPTTLVIALSLLLNATLGVVLFHSTPPATPSAAPKSLGAGGAKLADAAVTLRAALDSGDYDALRAAGVPVDVARNFAAGYAYTRYRAKLRAIQPVPDRNPRYWHASGLNRTYLTHEERIAFTQAEREFA